MGLQFQRDSDESGARPSKRPPNYFARGVQVRLLTLVGSLMLVGFMMNEARKPKNWKWMFPNQAATSAAVDEDTKSPGKLDTRLRRSELEPEKVPGAIEIPSPKAHFPTAIVLEDDSPLYQTQFNAWSQLWEELNRDQQELLQQVLLHSRREQALDVDSRLAWQEVVFKLHERWVQYIEHARGSMDADTSLSETEKKNWSELVDKLEADWQQETRPGCLSFVDGTELTVEQHESLNRVQMYLDDVALNKVKDNTIWRGVEATAWFRLLDRLNSATEDELREQAKVAGFLALYEQTRKYRGKLVSVRGQARLARKVDAPENIYGFTHYYILWVKPTGGPNTPLVVYCLELPTGFPEVPDNGSTDLLETVEVTGFLFKRWAYRSIEGINTTPMVLSKTVTWESTDDAQVATTPQYAYVVAVAFGCALFGIGVTFLVYRISNLRSGKIKELQPEKIELDAGQAALTLNQRLTRIPEQDPPSVKLPEDGTL